MNSIAVVICNYNKRDYVINCIKSVFDSSFNDFDVYVVDNASTDDSVKAINNLYNGKVYLIQNQVNLGGSGGFNTGIEKVLNKNYKYIMLLDNDVVLDREAIQKLYEFLETNLDVGIVGSKICFLDNPEYIQELGADIDFNNFTIKPYYKNYIDNELIPEIVECDYVPACSLLVRTSTIRKVGIMKSSNFIYWDDIEWGYRFKKAGYRVVAYSKSKVCHKMGAAIKENTFATYYFWRNKINFFATNCNDEQLKRFCKCLLEELFKALYSCNYQHKYNTIKTLMFAYDDALNNITGVADEYKILKSDIVEDRFIQLLYNKNSILINSNNNFRVLRNLINKIKSINKTANITVYSKDDKIKFQFPDINIVNDFNLNTFDLVLKMCYHIFEINASYLSEIYVDEYLNLITNDEDLKYCNNYNSNLQLFINCNYDLMLSKIKNLRLR